MFFDHLCKGWFCVVTNGSTRSLAMMCIQCCKSMTQWPARSRMHLCVWSTRKYRCLMMLDQRQPLPHMTARASSSCRSDCVICPWSSTAWWIPFSVTWNSTLTCASRATSFHSRLIHASLSVRHVFTHFTYGALICSRTADNHGLSRVRGQPSGLGHVSQTYFRQKTIQYCRSVYVLSALHTKLCHHHIAPENLHGKGRVRSFVPKSLTLLLHSLDENR